jgi:hypothetical protein
LREDSTKYGEWKKIRKESFVIFSHIEEQHFDKQKMPSTSDHSLKSSYSGRNVLAFCFIIFCSLKENKMKQEDSKEARVLWKSKMNLTTAKKPSVRF